MKTKLTLLTLYFLCTSALIYAQFTNGTFSTKLDFISGSGTSNPQGIAAGDIDGDGKLDLVLTNTANGTISIFRNNGSASNVSFEPQIIFTTAPSPVWVYLADVDNNGKLDVIVTVSTGSQFSIHRNTSTIGNISFANRQNIAANNGPTSIGFADLDGDNKIDLVATNYFSNNISIHRNTSIIDSISFAPKSDLAVGNGPSSVVIFDIDGDSKNDIAVTNYNSNSISIFRNTTTNIGSITLVSSPSISTPTLPNCMQSADLDGDGRKDLITANYISNNISIFRNASATPGTISFSTRVDFATGSGTSSPQGIAVVDINNDSRLDIAVANRTNDNLSAFMNLSSPGSFSSTSLSSRFQYATGTWPSGLIASDIDGDFRPDLVATNNGSNTFSFFRNQFIFTLPPLSDCFICKGDSVRLTATGGSAYSWSPSLGLSNTAIANPIAKPDTTTTYFLAVTTPAGILFDTVVVHVNQNCCINPNQTNNALIFAAPIAGNPSDLTPNPIIPTLSGNTTALAIDRFGNNNSAYNFSNGTFDKINYPAATKLSFTQNQSFSISAWTKVRSIRANPNYILSIFQNGGFDTYIGGTAGATPNKLCFVDFNGPTMSVRSLVTSPINFPLNTWNLITVTVNKVDSTNTLYLNGAKIAQVKANNSVMTNCGIVLGNHTINAWGLDGWIDDARIYNKALDSLEVKSLFDNRKVVILNNDTTIRAGDSLIIRTFNTASSYSWSPTIGVSNPTTANPVLKPYQSTTYILSAISASGCLMMDTIVVNVDSTISHVNEKQNQLSIIIYPNPAKGILNIDHSNHPAMAVRIVNMLGQTVSETYLNETHSTLELPNTITTGAYFVQCFQPLTQELILVKKLIVE